MTYYILRKGSEFVIYKVNEEDEQSFKEKYGKEIQVEADSMMQVLLKFEQEIMYSLDYIPPVINLGHLKGK